MKLHLDDTELKDAIKYHLSSQENIDLNPEIYDVDIQLTAGRGDKGHYADITRTKRGDAKGTDDPFDGGSEPDPEDSAITFD